jgi:hypothetical protein
VSETEFPSGADQHVRLAAGGEAYFGRDVLRGLVDGLREAAERPRDYRSWGPGLLGCAMWMDDPELISVLGDMANVCIVVAKQAQKNLGRSKADAVRRLAESNGIAQSAYYELLGHAPKVGSKPLVVGPWTPEWTDDTLIGAVREIGSRRSKGRLVPILHAKLALLGRMYWTDEDPEGHVDDHIWFDPEKLWVGSANFTESSRRSLEMGMWTYDPELMAAARRFLTTLVSLSEPLGIGPDVMDPELLPVDYDDDAFRDYPRDYDDLGRDE